MDFKIHEGSNWLGHQLHQLKEQEHAGPVLTTVVVVLLTYVLYTVSCPYDHSQDGHCWAFNVHWLKISAGYVCYGHSSH